MPVLTGESKEERTCGCGCGRVYPVYSGLFDGGSESQVAYRMAHLGHDNDGPHLWTMLGVGPWDDGDACGCWMVLHTWLDGDNFVTRLEDWAHSPFTPADACGERLLDRADVLTRPEALEWATEQRDQLSLLHRPTAEFLLRFTE